VWDLPHRDDEKANFTLASREDQLPGRGNPTKHAVSVRHRKRARKKKEGGIATLKSKEKSVHAAISRSHH
jgi:hypothetical protein